MEYQDVLIINLPAMKVASFYAFSSSPETDAWEKMVVWAKAHSCWQDPPAVRVFGFDNPSPSTGSPNYGYEFWLTLNPQVAVDADTSIKEFPGGLYGVSRCEVTDNPWESIPAAWSKLVQWMESSHYEHGNHQWLEEHYTRFDSNKNGFVLDLLIPLTE